VKFILISAMLFPNMMHKLRTFLETALFTNFIIAVILVNAVTLGLETAPQVVRFYADFEVY